MPSKHPKDVERVEDLLDIEDGLTARELEFVTSLEKQFARVQAHGLSEKQRAWVDSILERLGK